MQNCVKTSLLFACTLLAITLCGCNRTPPPTPQQEVVVLSPKESFYHVWAEVIARTEAINKKAKEIAQAEGLAPGDIIPPSRIGIRGASDTYLPGDEPYNILLDARIAGKEITFWILVGNTVPTMQETYAVASTTNPENGDVVYYPRTKATEAKVMLATTNIRTQLLEKVIEQRKAADAAKGIAPPVEENPPGERPRVIR